MLSHEITRGTSPKQAFLVGTTDVNQTKSIYKNHTKRTFR